MNNKIRLSEINENKISLWVKKEDKANKIINKEIDKIKQYTFLIKNLIKSLEIDDNSIESITEKIREIEKCPKFIIDELLDYLNNQYYLEDENNKNNFENLLWEYWNLLLVLFDKLLDFLIKKYDNLDTDNIFYLRTYTTHILLNILVKYKTLEIKDELFNPLKDKYLNNLETIISVESKIIYINIFNKLKWNTDDYIKYVKTDKREFNRCLRWCSPFWESLFCELIWFDLEKYNQMIHENLDKLNEKHNNSWAFKIKKDYIPSSKIKTKKVDNFDYAISKDDFYNHIAKEYNDFSETIKGFEEKIFIAIEKPLVSKKIAHFICTQKNQIEKHTWKNYKWEDTDNKTFIKIAKRQKLNWKYFENEILLKNFWNDEMFKNTKLSTIKRKQCITETRENYYKIILWENLKKIEEKINNPDFCDINYFYKYENALITYKKYTNTEYNNLHIREYYLKIIRNNLLKKVDELSQIVINKNQITIHETKRFYKLLNQYIQSSEDFWVIEEKIDKIFIFILKKWYNENSFFLERFLNANINQNKITNKTEFEEHIAKNINWAINLYYWSNLFTYSHLNKKLIIKNLANIINLKNHLIT